MSVASLIATHGQSVGVYRSTATISGNGTMSRTWTLVLSLRGFVQPNSSTDNPFAGRDNLRTSATVYFEGSPALQVDDVLKDEADRQYQVRGFRTPLLRPTTSANTHTIVAADYIAGQVLTLAAV